MSERIERDLIGEHPVPADAPWGIHTERARAHFRLSGRPAHPALLAAIARVKKSACRANAQLGYLDPGVADAIEAACDEVIAGRHADAFPVDALQGGAGTSTHLNVCEVVANLALDRLGRPRGEYATVHPVAHVNLHQSTNDVYPTALHVAAIFGLRRLSEAAAGLQGAFQRREQAFSGIPALGRTEGQAAVPMSLGAKFSAFAEALARDRWRTFKCEERLRVVNLGGTAVGTGLAAPRRYIFRVIEILRAETGLGLSRDENPVGATANADVFVEVSGMLKAMACTLIKVARDLRRLHELGEIRLPACQAGSSIMPGKVNPVLLEAAITAGLRVRAADALVGDAAALGSQQINEWLPLVADELLGAIDLLDRASRMLTPHVDGIEADPDACRAALDRSPAILTAFLPDIGYPEAERLLLEFRAGPGGDLRAFLAERLGAEAVEKALSPHRLMALGYPDRA